MRCYTVLLDDLWEGIFFAKKPFPHVPVGTKGKGCKIDKFPLSRQLAESLTLAHTVPELKSGRGLHNVSVVRSPVKKMYILVPETYKDEGSALVHVRMTGIEGQGSTKVTPSENTITLAEGIGRDGYGSAITHRESLVEMPPNSFIQVERNSEGLPLSDRMVVWDGKRLSLFVTTSVGGVQSIRVSC